MKNKTRRYICLRGFEEGASIPTEVYIKADSVEIIEPYRIKTPSGTINGSWIITSHNEDSHYEVLESPEYILALIDDCLDKLSEPHKVIRI